MLPTLIDTLQPLATSHALHLVVGLVISGAMLLILPDDRLAVPVFLVQRGLVIVLLWSTIGLPLVAVSAVAALAIGLIYAFTVWHLHRTASQGIAGLSRGALPLSYLPFRALATALAVLLTFGLVQAYAPGPLPLLVTWAVAWLLIQFCFTLLLAPTPLHTGLGALAFADAGRILYALMTRPDPLVWGLWTACDVLVGLAAAHLRTTEVAAAARILANHRDTESIETREIGSVVSVSTLNEEGAVVQESGSDYGESQETTDASASSAVSALNAESGQEAGGTP